MNSLQLERPDMPGLPFGYVVSSTYSDASGAYRISFRGAFEEEVEVTQSARGGCNSYSYDFAETEHTFARWMELAATAITELPQHSAVDMRMFAHSVEDRGIEWWDSAMLFIIGHAEMVHTRVTNESQSVDVVP